MSEPTDEQIGLHAARRAKYALAEIADNQMKTWDKYPTPDKPSDIIARQIASAIYDALKGNIGDEPTEDKR